MTSEAYDYLKKKSCQHIPIYVFVTMSLVKCGVSYSGMVVVSSLLVICQLAQKLLVRLIHRRENNVSVPSE